MMKKVSLIAVALVAALSLSACNTLGNMGMKQGIGTIAGAGLGALGGSQIGKGNGKLAAVAAGTLLGAFIGGEIGSSLDNADRAMAQNAVLDAAEAPIGQPIRWNNQRSGNGGYVRTVRDGYTGSGEYCREFQQVIQVGGRTQEAYGTACQQRDGSWRIQQD